LLEWEDRAMRLLLSLVLAFSTAGCGGLVVLQLDGDGETSGPGEEGGSGFEPIGGFSAPTDAATTGTGSDACASLLETLETAIDHARACTPLDPNIQCDGSVVLLDTCGCPSVVANENLITEIADAQAAYDAWVAAGCGPHECVSCTPATEGGFCDTMMGDPSKGRCTPNPP
jgi:hypothetical protein